MLMGTWRDAQWDVARWPNFSARELSCHCGGRYCSGQYFHDPDFLDALQKVRTGVNRSVHITSGHRCALWNAAVGGAALSQHKAMAVDISLAGQDPLKLVEECIAAGFNGFGFGRSFLHIDRRRRPARWDYGRVSRALWLTNLEGHPWQTFLRA